MEETLAAKRGQLAGLSAELAALEGRRMDVAQAIGDRTAGGRRREEEAGEADGGLAELVARRNALQNEKKEAWRREAELDKEIAA